MDLTELEELRVAKLERLRAAGVDPYPHRVTRTHTIAEAHSAYIAAEQEAKQEDSDVVGSEVSVTGRLRSIE